MSQRPEPQVDVPSGDYKKGAKIFKAKCAQCHTMNKGNIFFILYLWIKMHMYFFNDYEQALI